MSSNRFLFVQLFNCSISPFSLAPLLKHISFHQYVFSVPYVSLGFLRVLYDSLWFLIVPYGSLWSLMSFMAPCGTLGFLRFFRVPNGSLGFLRVL